MLRACHSYHCLVYTSHPGCLPSTWPTCVCLRPASHPGSLPTSLTTHTSAIQGQPPPLPRSTRQRSPWLISSMYPWMVHLLYPHGPTCWIPSSTPCLICPPSAPPTLHGMQSSTLLCLRIMTSLQLDCLIQPPCHHPQSISCGLYLPMARHCIPHLDHALLPAVPSSMPPGSCTHRRMTCSLHIAACRR